MTIELHLDDSRVKELLNAVVKNLADPQPALQKIGRLVVAGIQDNFTEGGAYSSPDKLEGGDKKWRAHSPVTIKIRERQGKKGPHQILIDSNRLRDSITEKADKESVVVGTIVEYAAMQHFGAKKGQFGIHDVLVQGKRQNGCVFFDSAFRAMMCHQLEGGTPCQEFVEHESSRSQRSFG